MKIGVLGLWHLGSVTAAALASCGYRVVGVDSDDALIRSLLNGVAPVFEPELDELIRRGLATGNLSFSTVLDDALENADVLWVAYDTAVDQDDRANTDFVLGRVEHALLQMREDTLMLISSQLPVGSICKLERAAAVSGGVRRPRIAYCPENLRLGTAVDDFLHADRIVVGVRRDSDKVLLGRVLSPLTGALEWMSIESAEMTKHAINTFLAASIVFANELASICESVGADAKEVERGLRTESRIGPRAYLSPGGAFAGGTLARDVAFLGRAASDFGLSVPLIASVLPSNEAHKTWTRRKLRSLFIDLSNTTICLWGLAYKAGTDTLRRSAAVDLCDWLIGEQADVRVFDPLVKELPQRWRSAVTRYDDPVAAAVGCDVLIVNTDSPLYRTISADQLLLSADRLVVLDANRCLAGWAAADRRLAYFAVGVNASNQPA